MTLAVVVDSTASLSPGFAERPDVKIVPLTFHFGPDESYRDKVDLGRDEFFRRLEESDVFPTTSQPSAGDFVQAYEDLGAYDEILVLTVSEKFSGTFESAQTAAGMVDRPIEVIDTESAEMGSGLLLREALRVIDEGGDFAEVKRAVESGVRSLEVYFAVGRLDYLARSGRIGKAQRLVGTALDIRPVLMISEGEIHPYKRTRGRKRQMKAMVDELLPAVDEGRKFFFGHVDGEEAALELADSLGVEQRLLAELGGVVGCHVGPGSYGVACL